MMSVEPDDGEGVVGVDRVHERQRLGDEDEEDVEHGHVLPSEGGGRRWLRDGVEAVATPGVAPADPPHRQPAAAHRTVDLEGLDGVRRAGGGVAARRGTPGEEELVAPNERARKKRATGDRRRALRHRRTEPPVGPPAPRGAGAVVADPSSIPQKCWSERRNGPKAGRPPRVAPPPDHRSGSGPGGPEPTTEPVALHGVADLLGHGEGQPGRIAGAVGGGQEGQRHRRRPDPSPRPPHLDEGAAIPDAPDQADRRWRPLSRRERNTARPARVDIRCRNPWRLARRRLLG